MIQENYLWIFLGCAVLLAGYILIHRMIMGSKKKAAPETEDASGAAQPKE